jgi:hypothetical protein
LVQDRFQPWYGPGRGDKAERQYLGPSRTLEKGALNQTLLDVRFDHIAQITQQGQISGY